eukprot:6469711-Amphidinium_carterae.2
MVAMTKSLLEKYCWISSCKGLGKISSPGYTSRGNMRVSNMGNQASVLAWMGWLVCFCLSAKCQWQWASQLVWHCESLSRGSDKHSI